jgi:hypothetical protein
MAKFIKINPRESLSMKKVLLLLGILLFFVGSTLFIGAYFIFNQYSVSGSHSFQGYLHETWQFPETPLELGEGDKVTVKILRIGGFNGKFYIKSTSSGQVLLSNSLSNSTLYYYVQTNDFYYSYIDIDSWSSGSVHSVTLDTMVISKAPNLLLLLIGIIFLLGSAITILSAFLIEKSRKQNSQWMNICCAWRKLFLNIGLRT